MRSPHFIAWPTLCMTVLSSSACTKDDGGSMQIEAAVTTKFIAMQDGAPEDVLWDEESQTLFIFDNIGNRVWTWTDGNGLAGEPRATCAPPEGQSTLPENVTLGQADQLADGTLIVTRFGIPGGDAMYGGVVVVKPDGTSDLVPNVDPSLHRLGVAVTEDDVIYVAGFAAAGGMPAGKITRVELDTGETLIADGFGKVVGLAIADDRLYISDQSGGKVLDAPLADLPEHATDWHTFAEIAAPDQICIGPRGSLFSGQFQAPMNSSDPIAVRRMSADGHVSIVAADPDVSKPSGVSYDPTHKRLFVADAGNVAHVGIHVFPVD